MVVARNSVMKQSDRVAASKAWQSESYRVRFLSSLGMTHLGQIATAQSVSQ